MFNSLKCINKAFDYIEEEEKILNYKYEPYYEKRNENWKRHLFFFELKKDFIKDVTELGFCPYIHKSCEEQRRDQNIMRFKNMGNSTMNDYIKNLYKKISPNKINEDQNKKSISPKRKKFNTVLKKNKSMKEINNKYKNNFLCKIYSKINKNRREIDNCKLKRTIDLNQNIENNTETISKKNKDDEQMEIESFIYEPERIHLRYNYKYSKNNSDEYNNKDESLSDSLKNKNNNQLVNNKSKLFGVNNFNIKKKGWRMTTTLDNDKFFRNLKSGSPFYENFDKNLNGVSFLGNNKKFIKNKFGNENFKNNYNKINLYKGPSWRNKRNNKFNKKITSFHKSKSVDKKFKLFVHIRKLKNELENE